MQLTQAYSIPTEGQAPMTKIPTAFKPKVPNKPSHLAGAQRKSLPLSTTNDAVPQKCVSKHISHRKVISKDDCLRKDENRRRSTNSIGTSKQLAKQHSSNSDDCCNYGEYVEINFPPVEPGTLIRTDDFSGEIETLPCCTGSVTPPSKERRKPTGRSISDTSLRKHSNRRATLQQHDAVISELGRKFRSNSLESLKPSSTADESGYEIPMSFQTPTYMCLDDDLGPFSLDETADVPDAKPKLSRNRKIRLARFRRKPFNPSTSPDVTTTKTSRRTSYKSDNDRPAEVSEETKMGFFASPKPLNSFLATRLRSISSDTSQHHHQNLVNRTSLSSSTITCSTCESDCTDEDEWSDSSEDVLAEYESFYQEINTSSRPRRKCDHEYETIEEFPGVKNNSTRSQEVSDVEPPCSSCKSVNDTTAFHTVNLNADRKLYKKNFQDMKCPNIRDCTWDTVATPGVLKHSELKNVLKLNFNRGPLGNERS